MNHTLSTCLFVTGLLLPLAGHAAELNDDTDAVQSMPSESTARTSSAMEYVEDSVITTKIKAGLAAEQVSSLVNIHVDTDEAGEVTLSGGVVDQAALDKAVAIAMGVEGVTSVKNDIKVATDQ
ncbi:BON domain-containing protein [Aeromonas bivalvium]|uniref:BON domain-containing protein n=1 Tax=Aeromonas bivalvium TaxID=440079 RepID=UPI0038D1079E